MARHAELMKLRIERQLEQRRQASELLTAASAKGHLAEMLKHGNLLEIFGDEISGVPTETVLAMMQAQIWGSGTIL